MRNQTIYVFLLVIFICISCVGKSNDSVPIERVQLQMGTYGRVLVYDGSNEDIDAAFAKIKELDNLLSDYNPESEISEINKNAGVSPVGVDPQVIEILEIAKNVAYQTNGVFDPTIGALTIGVYRFGRGSNVYPSTDDIEKARSLVNYKDLIIEHDSVYLRKKGMMIDLGGIGKGYAVQSAVDVLKEMGVRGGVVSMSGDLKVFGHKAEIAIQEPDGQGAVAAFTTGRSDLAISTSGSYERSVNVNGEIYHHLIVPKSGKSGEDFLSLTVVMQGSSTLADAYATALFVMGRKKAFEFLDGHDEIGAFIVFPDKTTYYNKTFINFVDGLNIEEDSSI